MPLKVLFAATNEVPEQGELAALKDRFVLKVQSRPVQDEFFTELLGETVHRVVIRHLEIDFRSGLVHTDDHVDVELELESVGTSSATTVERIRSAADGRLAAEARSVVVHTDPGRAVSEPWPDGSRRALEARL